MFADGLELFSESKKYVASGGVTIIKQDAVISADEITYTEETSEVKARGNVRYDDEGTSIRADRADLNIDDKTGTLYRAEFLRKKNNYHLIGDIIEKRGDDEYYSPAAAFTTCDLPVPEWCFKGKEVTATAGDAIKARDVSFLIKDVPVLYAPYLWASINTERQTGFLMPGPSYTKKRGAGINIPFFWAISENRDLTAMIDIYSKRGMGEGMEYRFIEPGEVKGSWLLYHIRDTLLDRDFFEIRARHEDRSGQRIKGFLNLNYVNERDYYREFLYYRDLRVMRFLESTAEITMPMDNSRVYLLSQYWIDLKNGNGNVPQKLPEAGYVRNYTNMGKMMLSASVTVSNMFREHGVSAARFDAYPKVMHSFGKDFTVVQTAGLRETFYSFYKANNGDDSSVRTAFEYDVTGHTRLYKNYNSFSHIIEPSLRYHFVSPSGNIPSVFDSVEMFSKTSTVELGLLNRGLVRGSEVLTIRALQGIDTNNGSRPFLPLRLDASLRAPVHVTVGASYDFYEKRLETASSEVSLRLFMADLSFGQRFNKKEEINVFTAGAAFSPAKGVNLAGTLWYDAKGAGLRDVNVVVKYARQCWSMRLEAIKKPGDFSLKAMVELTGLTGKRGADSNKTGY